MKAIFLGLAVVSIMSATAADAQRYPYHVVHTYLDENGNYAGRFTIYCNGIEEMDGEFTSNYYSHYGTCDAP